MVAPAVKPAALLAVVLALAACNEDSQRHAKRIFQQQVTNDGKLVKGVYLGKADTELDEATRNALRQRQSRQQF
jgi:uncharacterized protein (UPF0212 family)